MKLEHAFMGMLTEHGKGLQWLVAQLQMRSVEAKDLAESGDLEALKVKLAEGHEVVRKLESFFVNAEGKTAQLTTDENGGIIDLSVPPEQRRP